MVKAIDRPFPTSVAREQCQADPCEICSGKSGTGALFSPLISLHQCSKLTFIYTLMLYEGQTYQGWKLSKTQCPTGDREALVKQ
jgi:hypothetical protein